MPRLTDNRPTKIVALPSYPDSQVEIYDSLLIGDMAGQDGDTSNWEKALVWLPRLIKSWNFTDDNDQVLPVTTDNLKLLKASDMTFLMTEIQTFNQAVKKD